MHVRIYFYTSLPGDQRHTQTATLDFMIGLQAMLNLSHITFGASCSAVPLPQQPGRQSSPPFNRDHLALVCWMNDTGTLIWPTGVSQYVPPKSP